jgi:hypothetical protein
VYNGPSIATMAAITTMSATSRNAFTVPPPVFDDRATKPRRPKNEL